MPDIDTLEGAELDARVAEKVMGWHLYFRPEGCWESQNFKGEFERWRGDFNPTREPDDLLCVLDKALKDGCVFHAGMMLEGNGYWVHISPRGYIGETMRSAPTLPLAVCRALAKAYTGGENDGNA